MTAPQVTQTVSNSHQSHKRGDNSSASRGASGYSVSGVLLMRPWLLFDRALLLSALTLFTLTRPPGSPLLWLGVCSLVALLGFWLSAVFRKKARLMAQLAGADAEAFEQAISQELGEAAGGGGVVFAPSLLIPSLIRINSVVLLLGMVVDEWGGGGEGAFNEQWGVHGVALMRGEYWRLFSYQWLHGGVVHFLCNMVALASLGPLCERFFGWKTTLFFYLLAGLVSGCVMGMVHLNALGMGASGAIFGLFGAATAFLLSRQPQSLGPVLTDLKRRLKVSLMQNLALSLLPGISLAGHLAGFITGFLAGWGWRRWRPAATGGDGGKAEIF